MTRTKLVGVVVTGMFLAAPALAQVEVVVTPPSLRFEVQPALVVVSPGLMVVEDYPEEVFFVSGWYWHKKGPHWFRARDWRGGWVVAPYKVVPGSLVKLSPGKYRHFKVKHAKVNGGHGNGWDGKGHKGGEGKHGGGKHKGGKHK